MTSLRPYSLPKRNDALGTRRKVDTMIDNMRKDPEESDKDCSCPDCEARQALIVECEELAKEMFVGTELSAALEKSHDYLNLVWVKTQEHHKKHSHGCGDKHLDLRQINTFAVIVDMFFRSMAASTQLQFRLLQMLEAVNKNEEDQS